MIDSQQQIDRVREKIGQGEKPSELSVHDGILIDGHLHYIISAKFGAEEYIMVFHKRTPAGFMETLLTTQMTATQT